MLKKIISLYGIGVFYKYGSSGDGLDFSKNTVLYANNGYGKSTIVATIRSLKDNLPNYIIERKTLGKDIKQKAVVLFSNGTLNFDEGKWENNIKEKNTPYIAVFDEQFVQDNLFIKEIEVGHKKKIYQLIIGKDGKILAEKLNEAIKKEKDDRKVFNIFEKTLVKKNKSANVDNYLLISNKLKENADKSLVSISSKIKTLENHSEIENLLKFEEFEYTFFDFSKIQRILLKTMKSIHEDAKQKVQNHISDHLKGHPEGEEFLRLGTKIQTEGCPYCGQDFDNVMDLFEIYQSYFDEAYNNYQNNLENSIELISQWDFNSEINKIEKWMNSCETQILELKRKTGEDYEISLKDLSSYSNLIKVDLESIIEKLNSKKITPNEIVDIEIINSLDNIRENIWDEISKYQLFIEATRKEYSDLIKSMGSITKAKLLIEKSENESRVNRFSPIEIEWCSDYQKSKILLDSSEKSLEDIEKEITSKTKDIFKKFEKGTNNYLKNLRANYRISGLAGDINKLSTEAFADFGIVISDIEIKLKSKSKSPKPEFSNTLSSGDKNTLSLAFFFAWLDMQPNLSDLIVVFDDPLTSLDDNRRLGTCKVLRSISNKVKQVIILTHKKDFLFHLHDELPLIKGLSIKHDLINGSRIVPLDISQERKHVHYKRIDNVKRYLVEDFGPTVKDMQGNIRKLIEFVLITKYYPDFEGINTLKPMIDLLAENSILSRETISSLRELKDISSLVHHAESHGNPKQELERIDLLPELKKTLEILKII